VRIRICFQPRLPQSVRRDNTAIPITMRARSFDFLCSVTPTSCGEDDSSGGSGASQVRLL